MKKAKNDLDDSFSFDTGGMDEFFPLEDPGKNDTAPKGVKGYLKNVAKSVLNLGVKVNKQLYPAVFDLEEQIFDNSDAGSRVSAKQAMTLAKQKATEYKNAAKDIVKDISNDAKKAIKTGYFVKTEEEDNDMGNAFGDMFGDDSGFSFDGGDVTFDSSEFGNDDFDSGFDGGDSGGSVSSHISTSETIVKAEAASTLATLKSNTKLRSTVVGAAQAQIKNEAILFSQNIEIENERHRQKMAVLKNIATNIGKQIEQNNISLRAQMEYSAKSLAFSQDLAAMVKEIRGSIWSTTRPKTVEENKKESEFAAIYGDGTRFNKKAFLKNFTENSMANSAGGAIDGIKTFLSAMEPLKSMGMSNSQIVKMMGGSLVREGIVNSMTSFGTKNQMTRFNDAIRGLPAAFNRKLIQWSNDDTVNNVIDKIADKLPKGIGTKLKNSYNLPNFIKDQLGYATVSDSIHSTTNRYELGNPNDVHPFDNKAHTYLTQVIPHYLSSIDAGVNHKEMVTFDWESKKFLTKQDIAKVVDASRREIIRSNSGYSTAEQEFSAAITDNSKDFSMDEKDITSNDRIFIDKEGQPKNNEFTKEFDRMLGNFQRYNYGIKSLENENDLEYISNNILSGTRLAKCSPEIQMFGMKMFRRGIRNMMGTWKTDSEGNEVLSTENTEGREALIQLMSEQGSYISKMNSVNRDLEDRFAGGGSSIVYTQINESRSIVEDKINLEHKLRYANRRLTNAKKELDEANKSGDKSRMAFAKSAYNKAVSDYNKLRDEIKAHNKKYKLADTTDYFNEDVNESHYEFDKTASVDDNFDKYRMNILEDDSTNGVVKNIYTLLLSGIDVYTHDPKTADKSRTQYLNNVKSSLSKKQSEHISTSSTSNVEYSELATYEIEDFIKYNYPIYIQNEAGEYIKIDSQRRAILKENPYDEEYVYFCKDSDRNAVDKKRKMNTDNEDIFDVNKKMEKIPVIGKFSKLFNKFNLGLSSMGLDFIGKNFYDIENVSGATGNTAQQEEIEKIKKEFSEQFGVVKNKVNETKEDIKTNVSKVKTKVKDYAQDTKDFYNGEGDYNGLDYNGKGSAIDAAIHLAHGLGDDFKKTKFAKLPNKIKQIYQKCKESDDNAYSVLSEMFAGTPTGKKVTELWNSEKKVWDEFKNDVTKSAEFTECVKAKEELINTIKNSDVYNKLTDKQKELFDKLDVEGKKNNVLEKLDETKSTLTNFVNDLKQKGADKLDQIKSNENVQEVSNKAKSIKDDITGKFKEFSGDIKNSAFGETVNKYKTAVKNEVVKNTIQKDVKKYEAKLIQTRIVPRVKEELGKELLMLKNKHNIPLSNALNRIFDPIFHSELGNKSDTIEKARFILNKVDSYPELNSFKEPLAKFIEKRSDLLSSMSVRSGASYIVSRITSKIMDKVDTKAKGLLDKVLDKKLLQIKVGDKTLGEVLEEVFKYDLVSKDMIEKAKRPVDKANIILRMQNPEIAPFKAQIKQFVDDYDKSNAASIGTAMAWNKLKSVGSKALDWLKSFTEKDKTVEELVKRLGPDLTKILGGEENVIDTLLSAKITSEDIIALKTNDPIKIAEFLLSEGKFKRDVKKRIMVFIKLTMDKRAIKGSGDLKSENEFVRGVAKRHLDEINEKISNNDEELDKGEYKSAKKDVAVKAILRRKKSKLSQDSDGIANTAKEMTEDKEKKKQTEQMEAMAKNMAIMGEFAQKAIKDGLDLSKGTLKDIDESNKEAAEMSATESGGLLDTVLNKLGVDKGLGKASKALTTVSKLSGKGGVLGKVGGMANKLLGATGGLTSTGIAGAVKSKLGKSVAKEATEAAVKSTVKTAAKNSSKGLLSGAKNAIVKLLDGLLGKIGKTGGVKAMMGTIKQKIIQALPKCVTKVGSKLVALGPLAATGIGILVTAAAGFTKGMVKAKDYFKVGKGMRITAGMRLAAGLADALNSCLLGIPGIIATIFGFANAALWFYDIAGGDAEKEALLRYKKFNAKRAMIYGIDDPDALTAYENRSQGEGFGGKLKTGLNRGLRALGGALTFGLMKNNDEMDATILGFKHVKIFQKWKSDKYEPLDTIRKEVANAYGGLKVVEDVYAADLDDDGDGKLDEEDKNMYDMIQKQADYRVRYLEEARKYVIDNHLAYLTTHCSVEEFEKYSGEKAGEEIVTTTGGRIKKALTNAWKSTVIYKTGKFVADVSTKGLSKTLSNSFKEFGEKAKKLMEKLGFNNKQKEMMEAASRAIIQTENEVDPTYHNDKVDDIKPQENSTDEASEGVVNVGSNGGPESTGDGYFVKTVKESGKVVAKKGESVNKPVNIAKEKASEKLPGVDDSLDLSGKVPKNLIMNSITQDFAKNFGNELNKRLDILDEMHKEQVRHNEVSESFFASAISFLSTIAKNTGNIQVSDKLDAMIGQVTAF